VLLDGRTVANYAYSYYADGTLRTASEQHTEPNGSSTQRQLGWDYYPDGSLQYERLGTQQPRTFDYDSGGNMTLGVPAAPTLTAQYQFNQLRSLGDWTFSYNLNGERNAPDGNREYGYDGFGNLVWVRRNGQLVYEARYDALGRRIAYRTSNRDWDWIYLLYDGDMLVAELDANGQVVAEYVWGALGPVARIAGGRVQLYVCDALGHVRALIDAQTGQITDRYDYDAWGNLVYRAGTTRQPFTWNGAYGYEWVPEVSLYHVGARVYDPRTARWLQRDPIDAASGDPNLYRYCRNDSVNYRDPTGTEIQDEFTSVTCTRGRMEIVRMALEEARQVGSIRATQWWTYGKEFFQHHIFPQRLREFFKKIGIDVDDCIIVVAEWFHKWIHSGGSGGGWWNKQWDDFQKWAENELKKHGQSACEGVKKAAYEHAQRLLRAVGITDFDWKECLRYNSNQAKSLLKSLKDQNRKWD
jgi:RHS repeat-associated protein